MVILALFLTDFWTLNSGRICQTLGMAVAAKIAVAHYQACCKHVSYEAASTQLCDAWGSRISDIVTILHSMVSTSLPLEPALVPI